MAAPITFELEEVGTGSTENSFCPSSESDELLKIPSFPTSSSVSLCGNAEGDENPSTSHSLRRTATEIKRPSFYYLQGNTGLHPSGHPFDQNVIKRLDNLFDDTATEILEDEKLKTFLRIRPTANNGSEPKPRSFKVQKKVLEVKDDTTVVTYPTQKTVNSFAVGARMHVERNKKTEFQFTKVLGPECGQTTVFEECVVPLIEKFLRNENCLIFSYGATNSGKTYTLQGHGTDYGIIPRTLDAIFNRIQDRLYKQGDIKPQFYQTFHRLASHEKNQFEKKKEKILEDAANINNELIALKARASFAGSQSSQGSTVDLVGVGGFSEMNYALYANTTLFSVWVSFAELYNEKVYDLLENVKVAKNKRRKELKLLQDKDGYVYIKDLTELHVTSDDEAYKIFLAGRKNLQYATTQMNERSSRSHSFFTLRVVSVGIGEGLIPFPKSVHRMTFCDLAGMERAYQTENEGARLKESNNINSSLTVLLKVIRLLREKQTHRNYTIETIPFRESKLTHIFKSYLTSSTHVCMIVNVNPDPKMADSTLQVLHNSAIASNVIVFKPIEPQQHQLKERCTRNKRGMKLPDNKENVNPSEKMKLREQPKNKGLETTFSSQSSDNENQKMIIKKKVQFNSFSSSSSPTNSDDQGKQTVIATNKLLYQRIANLEKENVELRMKLAKKEHEMDQIREKTVKLFAEQNRLWTTRYTDYRLAEENISNWKLSLMQQNVGVLSPGNKCGRNHTPPKVHMENIKEYDGEEENFSADEHE